MGLAAEPDGLRNPSEDRAGFRDWRLYGEEGSAKREAAARLQPGSLTVEFGGEPLFRFDVGSAAGNGKLRAVSRPSSSRLPTRPRSPGSSPRTRPNGSRHSSY